MPKQQDYTEKPLEKLTKLELIDKVRAYARDIGVLRRQCIDGQQAEINSSEAAALYRSRYRDLLETHTRLLATHQRLMRGLCGEEFGSSNTEPDRLSDVLESL